MLGIWQLLENKAMKKLYLRELMFHRIIILRRK